MLLSCLLFSTLCLRLTSASGHGSDRAWFKAGHVARARARALYKVGKEDT